LALKTAHHRQAAIIDIRVNHLLDNGVSQKEMFVLIKQNYKTYISLKKKASKEEFVRLCSVYNGFCYLGKLVEFNNSKGKLGIENQPKIGDTMSLSLGGCN